MTVSNFKAKWTKWLIYIFWGVLSVFALSLVGLFGVDMLSQTQAGTGAVADTAGGVDFQQYICGSILGSANTLIGILAVVMMVIAGVTYATSMGGGGTSNAKEMMMAAITGVIFFFIGTYLMGGCGENSGWLYDFLPKWFG